MPDFNILQDRPLFNGVDREAFNKFAQVASYQKYQPGEVIIREGEQKDALMVIEKGQVEVLKGDISLYAEDQKVATLTGERKFCDIFRGDILGEMSLIDVEPASATVRAVSEVGIWSMNREDFAAVLRKDLTTYIVIITNIARILSRRLRDTGKIFL
ncbi:MAG: cyclic nucleotide-binding domain-containing protein [Desulfobacterales bacterium]|nr:MAG: cyclic nucleotide-binding domain-containing protein [Desulfobacterales bacterium]